MTAPAPPRHFVFHDARGRRWKIVRVSAVVACAALFVAALVFARSLFEQPSLRLPSSVASLRSQLRAIQRPAPDARRAMRRGETPSPRHSLGHPERDRRRSAAPAASRPSESLVLGFLPEENPAALASLARAAPHLTHLCPRWISLANEKLDLAFAADPETRRLARQHDLKVVALLTNELDGWRGDLIAALVTGPEEDRAAFIARAVRLAKAGRCEGIAVDFEEVDAAYADPFNDFLVRFAARCHEERLLFMVCVPVGWDALVFDLDRLVERADYLIAMLCNENSRHDPPGPLASQPWFERWLHRMLEFGRPGQWIVALGSFGCDWPLRGPVGKELSFAEAMSLADSVEPVDVEWAEAEANPSFSYARDEDQHTVWFLDAATAFNQARAALGAGAAGIGIWRLGSEDPGLWDALALARRRSTSPDDWASLSRVSLPDHVVHAGEGEVLHVRAERAPGRRAFEPLPAGRVRCRYLDAPRCLRVEHGGVVAPNWVALTFDDGPDRRWTPAILDVLKEERVPATFFVVGSAAEKNPDLLARIVREGHEVGVHTYTHPDLSDTPRVQLELELNATQRLIESLTGRSTILFRPPYSADSRPQTMAELRPILRAQELGYLTLCENIDPRDWERPGAAEILRRVKDLRADGSVVLLHDGGGDRRQTVEALRPMIRWLRESHHRPVRFITASELAGVPHDQVMPPAPHAERGAILATSFGLSVVHGVIEFVWAFLVVATVLVIFRSLAIALLALLQARRPPPPEPAAFPPVSVLVAAYNEERVIEATVRAALDCAYPGELEVVVVDDGSSDATASVVAAAFRGEPRLRLVSQSNAGKSGALRAALAAARHDLVVSLDADTRVGRGALPHLVAPLLADPRVGAVSGNARVGNRRRWLAKFQALEYTSGFNLDRRAFALLNCITVVPGAIGAYRRSAVEGAGGFTADTLAEDTDLTLQIRKDGWTIAYAPRAFGWTECPETVRDLLKQRSRWAFGTLQCLWKHRDALFNPRAGTLGWIAMPSLWFFQILLAAMSPLVDLLVLLSVLGGGGALVLLFLFAFLLSDTLLAALALRLDGEPMRRALWVLPQRFVYRPLLCIVVWGAFHRALRGALVSWGKVPRKATVRVEAHPA
jgi:cellulose synthase/poly-beta-1,6-N-acetylglucosamine synthase-like glycosyltransferase/peptidoglycan/xylan/chitin deacetylase (PgdA/CDA1 family)/spore germination protein YaaH